MIEPIRRAIACGRPSECLLLLLLLLPAAVGGTPPVRTSSDLAITHVTVIDVATGRAEPDRTVLIRDARITRVAPGGVPVAVGAKRLDGRGKFLIPGLWDMQVHLSWTTATALPLLVANGITDVRDMGGQLGELDAWRTQIASGTRVGPSIVRVGPMLNGKSFNRYQLMLGTPAETRGVVRALKFVGVDGLEIERRVERDSYFALMEEAKRAGLPVGGHIPIAVTPEEAVDAGQTTIEHVETLFEGTFAAKVSADGLPGAVARYLASGGVDSLGARFARNHTAFTPDIAMYRWSITAGDSSSAPDPRLRYVALSARNEFKGHYLSADDVNTMRETFPQLMQVVGRMHHAGVMLLAGTDIAGPRIPGFSLHDELSTLVEAGLTPLEALRTATLNPAIVLRKTADYGSIDVGKVADLVLLDADPLKEIGNTRRIAAVVLRGRLFRRSDLESMLARTRANVEQN